MKLWMRHAVISILLLLGLTATPTIAFSSSQEGFPEQNNMRSSFDCPAKKGESQKECRLRLKKKASGIQVEWSLPQEDDDIAEMPEIPDFGQFGSPYGKRNNYDGRSGWGSETGDCATRAGETQKECRLRLKKKASGIQVEWSLPQEDDDIAEMPEIPDFGQFGSPYEKRNNYDGRAGWESETGDCPTRAGETQKECRLRLKKKASSIQVEWSLPQEDDNKTQMPNLGSYDRQINEGCVSWRNGCDPKIADPRNVNNRVQTGEGASGNSGYSGAPNASGRPGNTSGPGYSGEPQYTSAPGSMYSGGNGQYDHKGRSSTPPGFNSKNPYQGVPDAKNGEILTTNGDDRLNGRGQYDNSDYLGEDVSRGKLGKDGSFGGYGSAIPSDDVGFVSQFKKDDEESSDDDYSDLQQKKKKDSWPLTLLFCALQIPFEGVQVIFTEKTCRRAIKEMCKYDIKRVAFSGPAQCLPFAPWNM